MTRSDAPVRPIQFGIQLWAQSTDWPTIRAAAKTADVAGWESIWTWDHLLAIFGPWEQPIFEGWMTLAGWAGATDRIRLGLMVGANTFRNPGLTARLATTLDHISGGRAVLGIGGAWFEREHEAFGFDFGSGFGDRLDRLDEAVGLMRRLLDGERVTHHGPHYRFTDAVLAPRPVQQRLPILVGGSGRRKTLRTVARYADAWNTSGSLADVAEKDAVLREHCAAEGRNPDLIERTVSFPFVIRDTAGEAGQVMDGLLAHNGIDSFGDSIVLLGSPAEIADRMRPYLDLGFRTIICRLPAPFDDETLMRIGEVRDLLAD